MPADHIDFALSDLHDPTKSKGKIRLLPSAKGRLRLSLRVHSNVQSAPNETLHFFNIYYDLVADAQGNKIPQSSRLIPVMPAKFGSGATPGGECPDTGMP